MFFSIIIPVFNSEKYIIDCLDSILVQSFQDYEVIIVDDGSTDGSREKCINYSMKDPRFHYFKKDNGGQFSARKMGIEKAQGKYIIPVDSDDMIRSDSLEYLHGVLSRNPVDLLIFGGSRDASFDRPIYRLDYRDGEVFTDERKRKLYSFILSHNSLNSFCMKVYSAVLIHSIKWNEQTISSIRNGEDMMQLLPLITAASSVEYCSEVLYYYRPNDNSASHRYNPNIYESRKVIYNELLNYSQIWGIYSEDTISALKLRTLRNIVSIIKGIRNETINFQKNELKRIGHDEWGKEIYSSSDIHELDISERIILFLLYNRLTSVLRLILNI